MVKTLEFKEAHQLFQPLVLREVEEVMGLVLQLILHHPLMVDQVVEQVLLEITKVQVILLLLVLHKEILVEEMPVFHLMVLVVVEQVELEELADQEVVELVEL